MENIDFSHPSDVDRWRQAEMASARAERDEYRRQADLFAGYVGTLVALLESGDTFIAEFNDGQRFKIEVTPIDETAEAAND